MIGKLKKHPPPGNDIKSSHFFKTHFRGTICYILICIYSTSVNCLQLCILLHSYKSYRKVLRIRRANYTQSCPPKKEGCDLSMSANIYLNPQFYRHVAVQFKPVPYTRGHLIGETLRYIPCSLILYVYIRYVWETNIELNNMSECKLALPCSAFSMALTLCLSNRRNERSGGGRSSKYPKRKKPIMSLDKLWRLHCAWRVSLVWWLQAPGTGSSIRKS